MEQQIVEIVVQIIIALLGLGGLYLIGCLKKWLANREDEQKQTVVDTLINQLVEAAEQMLKADDPSGLKRRRYVVEGLVQLGYKLTDILNAKIEAAVFRLNQRTDQ